MLSTSADEMAAMSAASAMSSAINGRRAHGQRDVGAVVDGDIVGYLVHQRHLLPYLCVKSATLPVIAFKLTSSLISVCSG